MVDEKKPEEQKPVLSDEKKQELKDKATEQEKSAAKKEGREVSQEVIDRIYGKLKETEERLSRSERDKVGLVGRVRDLERKNKDAEPGSLKEKYNMRNYPTSEEEWEELYNESPMYATDLRFAYQQSRQKGQDEQNKSREKLLKEHPDMYVRDSGGNMVMDDEGYPQLDMSTEKAKIFCEEAQKSGYDSDGIPFIMKAINGPEMVMAATMARLRTKEEAKVKEELDKKKKDEESKRQQGAKNAGVASGGTGAPAAPAQKVSFTSDFEKEQAEKEVSAGKYKDLEEYCRIRDNKVVAYGRGGF